MESHGERIKADARQEHLNLHAVLQHQQPQTDAQKGPYKTDDHTLPQKHAHHLERRGAQSLHDGNLPFALDGDGEHHRHDAKRGYQGNKRQHETHHHAFLLHQFKP